jgi:hypothetical protein
MSEQKPLEGSKKSGNIESRTDHRPKWDPKDAESSLNALYEYVIGESNRSESWYWRNKSKKARGSWVIQWTAVILTGLAGIIPILVQLKMFPWVGRKLIEHEIITQTNSPLIPSLLIGVSASLIGFDRFAGLSSGWARYVLTGTAIRSACEEFRMDWTALRAKTDSPPTPEQISALVQRAKTFRMAVQALITKETQDWATEFQKNLAELEKDLKAQVDQARAAREKAEKDLKDQTEQAEKDRKAPAEKDEATRKAAARPGSIEATVVNAAETDDFKFDAALENSERTFTEAIQSSQTWARVGVPAGEYRLTIKAQLKKRPAATQIVVAVKPGETTKAQVTLPAAP